MPTSLMVFWSMLVRIVTASKRGPVRAHWHASADGLRRGFEHGVAAERVHIDELHASHGCGDRTAPATVFGNVVEFQVEKNARAKRRDFFNCGGASGCEELVADFEHADQIGDLLCEFQRSG